MNELKKKERLNAVINITLREQSFCKFPNPWRHDCRLVSPDSQRHG